MKLLVGFIMAFAVIAVGAVLVIFSGVYNVAATAPDTPLERIILSTTMRYSVRAHAGSEVEVTWTEDQVKNGFEEYEGMCVICHGGPGKERSQISKGLRPQPPDLTEASQKRGNSELFWIIKNGVRMTGMPAFAPTHDDEQIWNIVGFLRRLPRISADEFRAMEEQAGRSRHHQ
jgi:mono/diheme cytochrome c family protein